jgi:diphthamide biosynthesis protein 4
MERTGEEDHYAVLRVHPKASLAEIKESYRRLALECHPDRKVGQPEEIDVNERFRRVQEAWSILNDFQARTAYDARRQAGQVAELPVGAEVDLDDMAFDEESGIYSHPCRCGHHYEVPFPTLLCSLA